MSEQEAWEQARQWHDTECLNLQACCNVPEAAKAYIAVLRTRLEATEARLAAAEEVEAQNMRCLSEIMRLERRLEEARAALAGAQEILAEPGTPPKSVWYAWQQEHASALARLAPPMPRRQG